MAATRWLIPLVVFVVAFATHADTQEATGKVRASRIFSATTTSSGQPIVLPTSNVEVLVWMYDIPPGSKLPVHKHPFQRYAFVLSGTLKVTDVESARTWEYTPGDFIIEIVGGWHYGTNDGKEPVRLLVIDQVEKGQANTFLR